MKTEKFGRLTPEEVKHYFHFDYSQFPGIEDSWGSLSNQFKIIQCDDCRRNITRNFKDLEEGKVCRYEHEPYRKIGLVGKEAEDRVAFLNRNYSLEPQPCRLFAETTWYHEGVRLWFPKGENPPDYFPVDWQEKSWTGATIVVTKKSLTIEKDRWLCPYCFFATICDYIIEEYSVYAPDDSYVYPHTKDRRYYDVVIDFIEKFFDEPVDWLPFDRKKPLRKYLLDRAEDELDKHSTRIFSLWVEGYTQEQIAEKIKRSIGYVNTRLRRVRESRLGFWYEEFFKGKGKRSKQGEPDLVEDDVPVNLKITGSKKTSKILRSKLQPEINYAKNHATILKIRIYNIVHDVTQELEFEPLEVPVEVKVDW